MKIKQIYKAIFDHDTTHYFAILGAEESLFWDSPCQHSSIWGAARQYSPLHNGLYWLSDNHIRKDEIALPTLFSGALSVLILTLYLVSANKARRRYRRIYGGGPSFVRIGSSMRYRLIELNSI